MSHVGLKISVQTLKDMQGSRSITSSCLEKCHFHCRINHSWSSRWPHTWPQLPACWPPWPQQRTSWQVPAKCHIICRSPHCSTAALQVTLCLLRVCMLGPDWFLSLELQQSAVSLAVASLQHPSDSHNLGTVHHCFNTTLENDSKLTKLSTTIYWLPTTI